jgi:ketosteroid isomerase-like protein
MRQNKSLLRYREWTSAPRSDCMCISKGVLMVLVEDTSAILNLERRRIGATNAGDTKAIEPLFADDIIQVHANGRIDDKASLMAIERSARRTIEPRNPRIRCYGDVAILTGPAVQHVNLDGVPKTLKLFITQVAARIDGQWLFVSVHATQMP